MVLFGSCDLTLDIAKIARKGQIMLWLRSVSVRRVITTEKEIPALEQGMVIAGDQT